MKKIIKEREWERNQLTTFDRLVRPVSTVVVMIADEPLGDAGFVVAAERAVVARVVGRWRTGERDRGSAFVTAAAGDSSREARGTNGSRRFSREEKKWKINMIFMFPFDSRGGGGGRIEFPDWL